MKTFQLLLSCALACCPLASHAAPIISELVAVGNSTHLDEDGSSPDWLEIHNPDGSSVNLGGYHLTDDPTDLTKWTFPATILPAGGYLVVFASDKDRAVADSELHTNFKLSSSGEYLALVDPDGSTVVDSFDPNFPPQTAAYSYGIGTGAVAGFFASPTPTAPHSPPRCSRRPSPPPGRPSSPRSMSPWAPQSRTASSATPPMAANPSPLPINIRPSSPSATPPT